MYLLNGLFMGCSSLIVLPDISKWNIFNSNLNNYFSDLDYTQYSDNEKKVKKAIKFLPYINYRDFFEFKDDLYIGTLKLIKLQSNSLGKEDKAKPFINSIYNMSCLFSGCSSLKSLPDISNWNLQNTKDISFMFGGCTSLISLPDISNWNTKNITDMNSLFFNCSSLTSLPDISKWDIFNSNIINYESGLEYKSKFPFENYKEENKNSLSSFFYGFDNNDIYLEDINSQMPKTISYKKAKKNKLLLSNLYSMKKIFAGCSKLKY